MLDRLSNCCRLLALLCVVMPAAGLVQAQTLWFIPPASDAGHQGFVRITNPTDTPTFVTFVGFDDAGVVSPGSASFTLGPQETKHFNSTDIEIGNTAKGLTGALGTGNGNWRLEFSATGVIEATALIRVPNGFLTSVHDADPNKVQISTFHVIPTVNPAKNVTYPSVLRFVNPNDAPVTVKLFAYENSGLRAPALGTVSFTIGNFKALHLTAVELENGAPSKGLATGLGVPGTVKWRITVSSDLPIKVMNLIYSPSGYITELPTESTALNEANFFYCSDFDGAMVFSQDPVPVYLGFFGKATATDSISNSSGPYGSASSSTSMRNTGSAYGSSLSGDFSAVNPAATKPPRALKNSRVFGAVTANPAITGISLASIDAVCPPFTSAQRANQ